MELINSNIFEVNYRNSVLSGFPVLGMLMEFIVFAQFFKCE